MSKSKSPSYPYISLKYAIQVIKDAAKLGSKFEVAMLSSIGKTGSRSHKSGAFIRKISALTQFHLISIQDKDKAELTEIAKEIVYPDNENSLMIAVKDAFLKPPTFNELYSNLQKNIPIEITLIKNYAIKQLKITEVGAKKFIDNFIESGIYSKCIELNKDNTNEIILLETENQDDINQTKLFESKNETNSTTPTYQSNANLMTLDEKEEKSLINDYVTISIPLSTGHTWTLKGPKFLSEDDKKLIDALYRAYTNSDHKGEMPERLNGTT